MSWHYILSFNISTVPFWGWKVRIVYGWLEHTNIITGMVWRNQQLSCHSAKHLLDSCRVLFVSGVIVSILHNIFHVGKHLKMRKKCHWSNNFSTSTPSYMKPRNTLKSSQSTQHIKWTLFEEDTLLIKCFITCTLYKSRARIWRSTDNLYFKQT